MADLSSTIIHGDLAVQGHTDFRSQPTVNGRPMIDKRRYGGNFTPCGTYYMLDHNSTLASTSIFAQNPLSATAQIVNMSTFIPSELRGLVIGIDVQMSIYIQGTSGSIFYVVPRNFTGVIAYLLNGYRFGITLSRWSEMYTFPTDENGDFEIYNLDGTATWQTRIENMYLKGIYTR